MATQLATFEFARASFQPGRMTRKAALQRAKKQGFDVLVESEVLGTGASAALTLRVVDVATGRPIHRQQQVVSADGSFSAAEVLVAELRTVLPEKLSPAAGPTPAGAAAAKPDQMQAAGEGGR